ncbi:MAG TPA: hypothetical protein VF796_22050 [Humisphaera sp.]
MSFPLTLSAPGVLAAARGAAQLVGPPPAVPAGGLDVLALAGFLAAFGALFCYAHRGHGLAFKVPLAACLLALSAYALALGAWSVGLAEAFWAAVAVRDCLRRRTGVGVARRAATGGRAGGTVPHGDVDSRLARLFGTN